MRLNGLPQSLRSDPNRASPHYTIRCPYPKLPALALVERGMVSCFSHRCLSGTHLGFAGSLFLARGAYGRLAPAARSAELRRGLCSGLAPIRYSSTVPVTPQLYGSASDSDKAGDADKEDPRESIEDEDAI